MAEAAAEQGYAGATVRLVAARAGVSRRTFYACFESREACFLALLDLGADRAGELVTSAFAREKTWEDGVRSALASVLGFLDSEPVLARAWLVEPLSAGSRALQRRERNLAALRTRIVSSWPTDDVSSLPPVAAESAIVSVAGLVHGHVAASWSRPLTDLLGPLMGFLAAQYLPPDAVAFEIERGEELAQLVRVSTADTTLGQVAIPSVLRNPNAHRARTCLLFLAEHPQASNREIASGIGVAHDSQVSKLLSSLLDAQLVSKHSKGVGKRNAWWLTAAGQESARMLRTGKETRSDAHFVQPAA
jgi:AcrR family transcriptional regulator